MMYPAGIGKSKLICSIEHPSFLRLDFLQTQNVGFGKEPERRLYQGLWVADLVDLLLTIFCLCEITLQLPHLLSFD